MHEAASKGYAVPAFNIYNLVTIQAVIKGAEIAKSPVILAAGSGALNDIGFRLLYTTMQVAAEEAKTEVSIHLDHAPDVRLLQRWENLGAQSGMIDGSKLAFLDNLQLTKEARDAVKPDFWLEAELGRIEGNEDENLASAAIFGYTNPDEAQRFAEETKLNGLAVSIGNIHGRYRNPVALKLDLLEELARRLTLPLVLHGASGVGDAVLQQAIDHGVRKINFNFELRTAFIEQLAVQAKEEVERDRYDMIRLFRSAQDKMSDVVVAKCAVLGSAGKSR